MKATPPKAALRFFRWFCTPELRSYIEGDLTELFENQVSKKGLHLARVLFIIEVMKLFRPGIIKPLFGCSPHPSGMLKHNLLISFRNFRRHRLTFLINLIGLTSGLTCALFIYLWVDYEYNVDKFHENDQRLYRLVSDANGNETLLNTSSVLVDLLTDEIPEIESSVNSSWATIDSYLSADQEFLPFRGEFASPEFFNFFSYSLISGDPDRVLNRPKSVVLSEQTALLLFHSTNVIGRTVKWSWYHFSTDLEITGVFAGTPIHSSEQFDYVLSFDVFEESFSQAIERGNRNSRSFLKLAQGANPKLVEGKIKDMISRNYEETRLFPFLIPFSSLYLYNQYENGQPKGGRIEYVRLFVFLAILIVLVACINFMNFSTARASSRLKEMGVKKVIGSTRQSLIIQHFSESLLMNLIAGLLAVFIVIVLLPEFRALTDQPIYFKLTPLIIGNLSLIILASGLTSGIYPALYLSGFNPLMALNGRFKTAFQGVWLRKGLVIFQFGVSLILIVAVLVVQNQVSFLRNKQLGYNKEQLISISTKGLSRQQRIPFIEEVKRLPGVINASGITHALFGAQRSGANIQWPGKDPDALIWFDLGYVYYDMLEMLEIPLLRGRTFSRDFGSETNKVVLNETAWRVTGLPDPIGESIDIGDTPYEIIGITEDFHFHSLHQEIRPTIMIFSEVASKIVAKTSIERERETVQELALLYSDFNPSYPFQYTFHSEDYDKKYVAEARVEKLSKYFAALAILISCLGLFGLTTFMVEQRKKEISIRKILGATPNNLFYWLTKDYLALLLVSVLIGAPLSVILMGNWLENFAYHTPLDWEVFLMAISAILLLSLVVISLQVVKAAILGPIDRITE